MKYGRKIAQIAAILCGFLLPTAAAYTPPAVPDTIFEWVQSSPRINYYFNKQMIHYGVTEEGFIDLNLLVVPALKTYDAVQIEDFVEKRRWRMMSVEEYADLAGEANYFRIDLGKRQVIIDTVDMLDSHFTTIERSKPGRVIDLDTLSPQSRDTIFYQGIIDYVAKHRPEIIKQTKGTLTEADQKRIEKEQKALEKAEHEREKAREKERREREKQEAKERKEREKREAKERKEREKQKKESKGQPVAVPEATIPEDRGS